MKGTKRRRARQSAAQWAAVVAEYRRSGTTQEAFTRSRGVGVAALRNHLYRRGAHERGPSAQTSQFSAEPAGCGILGGA